MTATRPDTRSPSGSEITQDPSLRRDPQTALPSSPKTVDEVYLRYPSGVDRQDPNQRENPSGNPKRATGLHPAIRATSTDDEPMTPAIPRNDDPLDDTPGEAENPQREEDEDFIEDALADDTQH